MQDKKAMLVVSFGTSHKDTREKTIDAIEKDVAAAYPDWEQRRAFTSGMIMRVLKQRDGIHTDNVEEAMEKLVKEGFEEIFIQPTHIINGDEYDKLVSQAEKFADLVNFTIGAPLLTSSEDYEQVCQAVMAQVPELQEDEALVLMGHGTGHHADAAYAALDYRFKALGYNNVFVGTVEGYPEVDDILQQVKDFAPRRVLLLPFMIVAGDHAKNDMAGGEEDSWNRIFAEAGFEVECILKGLGEFPEIRKIFLSHIEAGLAERAG